MSLAALSPGLLSEASAALQKTYGAYLIGTSFSLILYGVSVLQFYRYARLYPDDKPSIKTLVYVVMILETAQVPMLIHTCYWALVTHYFDPVALENGIWSVQIAPTLSGVITITAQAFFARRVALLGFKYKIVVAIAWLCLFAFLGMAIALTVIAVKLHNLNNFGPDSEWLFGAGLWFATAADFLLAGAIITALYLSRKAQGRGSESKFELFVLYFINTGTVFNAIPSILATTSPRSFIWTAISYVAIRLYAITLLAVLNSRKLMISRGVEIFGSSGFERNIIARATHLAAVEQWNAPKLPDSGPAMISIQVTAEMEADAAGTPFRSEFRKRDYEDSV
ncbi:hypothetical protein C8Q77DRAFT_1155830 [Trametes polyzona]|nr:hypothetical protein C8Q77DRAFT_1155830 [Trametes polyzona]